MSKVNLLVILSVVGMFGVTWYMYPSLPEQIPIHYNSEGIADDYAGREYIPASWHHDVLYPTGLRPFGAFPSKNPRHTVSWVYLIDDPRHHFYDGRHSY